MKSSTKLVYRKSDPPSEKGFYDSEAGVFEDNESTDKLDSRLNSRHKGSGISGKPCKIIVSILLLLLALYQIWASLMRLYPEWNMAIHSTCKIRTRGWNGKIPLLNLRIGYNRNEHRPRSYNVYHRVNATGDRRRLGEWFLPPEVSSELTLGNTSASAATKPYSHQVIIWGTHHRTGTHLASKLFAMLCASQKWCCVFHPTRDSIEAIRDAVQTEDVFLFGHNQWIWNPRELFGDTISYRFVHFHRNPLDKIISGFEYHTAGGEAWTKKPLPFGDLCAKSAALVAQSVGNVRVREDGQGSISREQVVKYCESVHLCETCCRRAHELPRRLQTTGAWTSMHPVQYSPQGREEYAYLCEHLGQVQGSLYDALQKVDELTGLEIEASLQYFENRRMVEIMEQTAHDPNTMSVGLQEFISDFSGTVKKIISHTRVELSADRYKSLMWEMEYLDIARSPLYHWAQSNIFNKHVQTSAMSSEEVQALKNQLLAQAQFVELYKPMLDRYDELWRPDEREA